MPSGDWKADKDAAQTTSADAARRALLEREAAELARRQRCNCTDPLPLRKYLGAWMCAVCLRPKYAK